MKVKYIVRRNDIWLRIEELRTQPQDIQAEQSVLGAIFIDEGKLVFVREFIEPADFFKYAHRLIFKAMIDLADREMLLMQPLFATF
mgnify:CR=1 FL=1